MEKRAAVAILLLCAIAVPAQQGTPVFKAETNLVLVPVVVRNARGEAVGTLAREDFQLFEDGKSRPISSFSVEETSGRVVPDRSVDGTPKAAPMIMPEHFVALVFDDLQYRPDSSEDLAYPRKAALKFLDTLQPADRVAFFTTSGAYDVDFTADRSKIKDALMKLRPWPTQPANNEPLMLATGIIRMFDKIVGRMSVLPGQRTVVFLSLGLNVQGRIYEDTMQFVDHAVRSRVVINTMDVRGLTAEGVDVHGRALGTPTSRQLGFQLDVSSGTGGKFIRDTNDMDGAIQQLAATPKYIYVLGFTPDSPPAKDGFHKLEVKLRNGHGLDVQARAGYYDVGAPVVAEKSAPPASATPPAQYSEADTKALAQALELTPAPPEPSNAVQQATPVFKAETNLVLVPVVVRNSKGEAVGTLAREDFQLFEDGKSRPISSFSLEETSGRVAEDRNADGGAKAAPMVMPDHFVALMFDDAHLGGYGDLVYSRKAVLKYLDTLQPADRVAFFTASGLTNVDFTSDRAKIKDALMKLGPGPSGRDGSKGPSPLNNLTPEQVTGIIIGECNKIVSRMALLPGQRTFVFISSGLPIEGPGWSAVPETMSLVDRAIRSRVVISGMDTRGLTADGVGANGRALGTPTSRDWGFQMDVSDGTGGKFIRDTNDLDGAIKQLAATPKYIYVLGFTADSPPAKDKFHKLEVKLRNGHGLDVQARSGYYDAGAPAASEKSAPKAPATPPAQYSEAETKALAEALQIMPAPPAESSKAPTPATAPPASAKTEEMTTTDRPATFTAQSNLVEVPVVVHDSAGHAIGNLRQEDFRILDKGKRQEISKFAVVEAGAPTTSTPAASGQSSTPGAPDAAGGQTSVPPTHFVAFVFDDLHILFADLPQVRNAVRQYLSSSVQVADRVALFTTSGKVSVDFTSKAGDVDDALLKVVPNPITPSAMRTCLNISYFEAFEIAQQVGMNASIDDLPRSAALKTAVFDTQQCLRIPDPKAAVSTAMEEVRQAYGNGEQESRAVLANLKALVRRMSILPGQRTVILVSPGFFLTPEMQNQNTELVTLATRSRVLINTIDARGVWVDSTFDASRGDPRGPSGGGGSAGAGRSSGQLVGSALSADVMTFRHLDAQTNDDELIALAEDTGGAVNLNNDFFGGVQKAAVAPEYMYVLGFVPSNLKFDGSFHTLKVSVAGAEKLSLQARRGYWAPKHSEDEAEVSKQEIENAVFSRDEVHDLPAEMHTRWMTDGQQAKLTVLTSLDLKLIHLRKEDDRNRNDLTIVAAVFDSDGNFVSGIEKTVQFRLLDETVARLPQRPPATIATDFVVKPGQYMVRLVVRDAEGGQITAENAAVSIQ
jgi:VWFA-related protein